MAGPWYYDSAVVGGTGTGLSWANARTTLTTMTSVVAGDFIYVAHTHAEAPGSAVTITFPGTAANPNHVICVDKAGSVPPLYSDWRTTASVATTGTFNISVVGSAYIQGITFNAGIGSSAVVSISVDQATGGTVGNWQHFENCVFRLSSTSANNTSRVVVGQSTTTVGNRCTLTNTQFYFTNANNNIQFACGQIEWRNTADPFPSATLPTTVVVAYGTPFNLVCEGVNFQWLIGRTFFAAGTTHFRAAFYGCLLPAMTMTATLTHPSVEIYLSSSGWNLPAFSEPYETRYTQDGIETTDAQVARVGGAHDGGIPHSRSYWVFDTVVSRPFRPYVGIPLVKWNDVTGADLTLTVYVICAIPTPTNGDIWLEAHYFADTFAASRSPLMAIDHNGRKPNFQSATTNHTADTSDWTAGTVPARQNSTAYTLTHIIKVASNPGRLFAPVGAGTTAASEPAGFASCLDGATVADGSVLWRALNRFKMTITLNSPQPQLAGPVYLFVKTPSYSNVPVIWVDPEIG